MKPEDLGVTLTHEHLSMVFDVAHVPADAKDAEKANSSITLENLGWIRHNPFSHKPNLVFNDQKTETAIHEEMEMFKKNGGGTIVENTTNGLQRNVTFMKELAQKTGVNIIAGTGYYVAAAQSALTLSMKQEEMELVMTREITEGCEDTGIRCGIIGELGCSWPLHSFEKTVLRAAANVQQQLGAPVIIHPGRDPRAPYETLRYFQENGGDVTRTVMSHLDRTIFDQSELLEFASQGSYCEFDMFGIETAHYQLNPAVDMPNDGQRIRMISQLVDEGYAERVLLAHDMYSKHRLVKFGGHGYSHILQNVVPMMLTRGISQQLVDQFLINNPKRWLTFK